MTIACIESGLLMGNEYLIRSVHNTLYFFYELSFVTQFRGRVERFSKA
jgi:hypothetical protein